MEPQLLSRLAGAILLLHVVVIAFNVLGLVAIPIGAWRRWAFVRVFWLRTLHMGILAAVAVQALLDRVCFLTLWQSDLMRRSGETASDAPLIQTWVNRLIFWPLPIWVFAVLYVAVCICAMVLWWLVPPKLPWKSAYPGR
jgi:hypothetical protein